MKRKFLVSVVMALVALMCVGVFASCGVYTQSDKAYWFSKAEKSFVAYDSEQHNIDEAGTYWDFTSAYEGDVTMKVRMNVDNFYSAAYLYVNDVQVQSDADQWYTYSYALSLKKGDKIQLHAFWAYAAKADNVGFTLQVFVMNDGSGDFVVESVQDL
jgi:hypothetical protein